LVSIWPDALFYEISGLSWSGNGRISKVEVSVDGGKSWRSQPNVVSSWGVSAKGEVSNVYV
jgi:hypothetical protein